MVTLRDFIHELLGLGWGIGGQAGSPRLLGVPADSFLNDSVMRTLYILFVCSYICMFCVCMGVCGYPRKYMTISFHSVKVMVWKTIIRTFVLFLVRHVFSGVIDHVVSNNIKTKTGAGGDPS